MKNKDKFCVRCGALIDGDSKLCPKCLERLSYKVYKGKTYNYLAKTAFILSLIIFTSPIAFVLSIIAFKRCKYYNDKCLDFCIAALVVSICQMLYIYPIIGWILSII